MPDGLARRTALTRILQTPTGLRPGAPAGGGQSTVLDCRKPDATCLAHPYCRNSDTLIRLVRRTSAGPRDWWQWSRRRCVGRDPGADGHSAAAGGTSSSSGTIVGHSPTLLNARTADAASRYANDNSRKKIHNVVDAAGLPVGVRQLARERSNCPCRQPRRKLQNVRGDSAARSRVVRASRSQDDRSRHVAVGTTRKSAAAICWT